MNTLIIESIEWVSEQANGHSNTLFQMKEPCSDDTRRMALGVAVYVKIWLRSECCLNLFEDFVRMLVAIDFDEQICASIVVDKRRC